MQKIIIATVKSWNVEEARQFCTAYKDVRVKIITDKKDLTYRNVKAYGPDYIFFPHWSWKIPGKIFQNYHCVVFHMTDLPYGRGGSPLQNLISRRKRTTKISAIRAIDALDAGPVYLKNDLDLEGRAQDIYKRMSSIIFQKMIPKILIDNPSPVKQKGKEVYFRRKRPEDSQIATKLNLRNTYDHIRMLDAEGYPPAFIETERFKIEFTNARYSGKELIATAKLITKRK